MTRSVDYLYDLLPAVHRMRDEGRGWPLRDLLRVIGEQVNLLEEDIERLYENWFIETCDEWVVPYLGDLVGYPSLSDAGLLGDPDHGRRAAAHTDPGTATRCRQDHRAPPAQGHAGAAGGAGRGRGGWPARVVESYPLLGWTQHLDHRRPSRGQTADLRYGDRLERLGGPFDDVAHTVDVRRPTSHRSRGRYAVPSVALFVWRIGSYAVTGTPAACIEREGAHCYTFSVLGNDTPLHNLPVAEPEPTHIAEEVNVPAPIRRRAFERRLSEHPLSAEASPTYYGIGKSLSVEVQDWPKRGARGLVPVEAIVPADLWTGTPTWRPAARSCSIPSADGSSSRPVNRRGESRCTTTTVSARTSAVASTGAPSRNPPKRVSTGYVRPTRGPAITAPSSRPGATGGATSTRPSPTMGRPPAQSSSRSPTAASTNSAWSSTSSPARASSCGRRPGPGQCSGS